MSSTDLVSTGILMGIIHVVTGPDHLAALATLCGTNIKKSSQGPNNSEAFLHGIRWGIGHTIGLLLVTSILLFTEKPSGEWVTVEPMFHMITGMIVGIFMLGLGVYGIYKADKNNRESIICPVRSGGGSCISSVLNLGIDSDHIDDSDSASELTQDAKSASAFDYILDSDSHSGVKDDDISVALSGMALDESFYEAMMNVGPKSCDASLDTISLKHTPRRLSIASRQTKQIPRRLSTVESKVPSKNASTLVRDHTTENSVVATEACGKSLCGRFKASCCGMCRHLCNSTPGVLALMAGLLHGVAGPGGVLGVIPAVQLSNPKLAGLYLGSFCITSAAVMGGFAAFYGITSAWLAGGGPTNRIFVVEMGSALLSVCVGFIWLMLLSLGELDEVFPRQ